MRIIVEVPDDPCSAERDLIDAVTEDGEITVYVWRRARRVASALVLPAAVEETVRPATVDG